MHLVPRQRGPRDDLADEVDDLWVVGVELVGHSHRLGEAEVQQLVEGTERQTVEQRGRENRPTGNDHPGDTERVGEPTTRLIVSVSHSTPPVGGSNPFGRTTR